MPGLPASPLAANRLIPPWMAALLTLLAYTLASLPVLSRHGFDAALFIDAGDRYVRAAALPSPIPVHRHSLGYDGQFYYRLALAPFDLHRIAYGISFDNAAWRMQRILYPLLAWALALGRPAWVPTTLYLVNLLALAAIGAVVARIARRLSLPAAAPLAMLLLPGFIVTLTQDTTEIVAAAFLLAALDAYLGRRLLAYALLGAVATLARETAILTLGGIAILELVAALRAPPASRSWRSALLCCLALLPFLLWREVLEYLWGAAQQDAAISENIGWPLSGAVRMLFETVTGIRHYPGSASMQPLLRGLALASALWLLAVCAAAARFTPTALRRPDLRPLAAAWLPVAGLMTLLPASGPWIDSIAWFRAFTECYLLGVPLVAAGAPRLSRVLLCGAAVFWLYAWHLGLGLGGAGLGLAQGTWFFLKAL
jgi:hypothetical protein